MAEQNVEYQSLVQCADDLTQLIQHNVMSLSSKLFAKALVAKDVHDSVLSVDAVPNQSKAAKLLSCVIDKIKDSADRFQDFIDVLGEESYFEDIVLKITKVHKTLLDSKVKDFQDGETIHICQDNTVESDEKKQVAKRIKMLEKSFIKLKKSLLAELKAKAVTPEVLLEEMTFYLPLGLQKEYGASIREKRSDLEKLGTVSNILSELSPHFTILDYSLLEHLIEEFGSEQLKLDMSTYVGEIVVFLGETTIAQLQDHFPGQQELPPHFDRLQMMIDKDPGKCSLQTVNDLRRRFCSETHLSEIVFVLIGIGKANSFIIVFMVPSVLGARLVESVGGMDDSFYQRECIISISLNQQHLYLSAALRENKAECEKRLLVLCDSNTGDIQEFTYILSQPGMDPNIHDQDGRTPLVLASNNGRNKVIQLLLNHGAKIDFPNIDSKFGDSPLIGASRYGHVATCQLLIDQGATIDYRHKRDATALMVASQEGHIKVVQLLLDCGAELNIQSTKDGITSLHQASQNGHKEILELLLTRGASVDILNTGGMTAMAVAASRGHKQVVDLLLKAGAKIDIQNKGGRTALAWAAYKGHEEIVDVLLKAGAKLDVQDKNGRTSLVQAALKGHEQVVDVLLKAGAKLDVQDKDGLTALMEATWCGHKGVIKELMESKANPNIANKIDGRTALHYAAAEGNVDTLGILLEGGADVEVKDKTGVTAHDVASICSHPAVCQLLELYGYKPSHPAPLVLQSTSRHDPVTSLQTFRDVLKHGSKLSDVQAPKHPASHNPPGEYNEIDEAA